MPVFAINKIMTSLSKLWVRNTRQSEQSSENNLFTAFQLCKTSQTRPCPQVQPVTLLIGEQQLSPDLVDLLAEAEHDWISVLHPDWEIELCNPSLLGVTGKPISLVNLMHVCTPIKDFIPLILQAPNQKILVSHQMYSIHSCCFSITGLGRIRLVISHNNPHQVGEHLILVTNRLDWSPRTVLTRWLQGNLSSWVQTKIEFLTTHQAASLRTACN